MGTIFDCLISGKKKEIYEFLGLRKGRSIGLDDINGIPIRIGDILYSPFLPFAGYVVEDPNGHDFFPFVQICCSWFPGCYNIPAECVIIGIKERDEHLIGDYLSFQPSLRGLAAISSESVYRVKKLLKESNFQPSYTKFNRINIRHCDIRSIFEKGILSTVCFTDYDFSKCKKGFGKIMFERFKKAYPNFATEYINFKKRNYERKCY